MRKCNHDVKLIINNKLYQFPAIAEGNKFVINEQKLIDISADTITITLPLTNITKQIIIEQCFIAWANKWQVQGIDYTKDGLVILNCKSSLTDANDDLDNQIADRYIDGEDILNGNIEPILPFGNDEQEPEEPEEPQGGITYTIDGPDHIYWNETKTYTVKKFINDVEVEGSFTFELEGDVADITGYTDNTVDIKAKSNIYYKYATLRATDIETGEYIEVEIMIQGLI